MRDPKAFLEALPPQERRRRLEVCVGVVLVLEYDETMLHPTESLSPEVRKAVTAIRRVGG